MYRLSSIVFFGILILLIMSTQSMAQRGGRGGFGDRGGFDRERMEAMRAKAEVMRTPDIGWLWAALSFDIALTEEQRPKIEAVIKSTWNQRQTWIADAERRNADWKIMAEEMRDMEKLLDKQIEELLTDDQEKQLKALKKQREKRMEAMRPGR